MAAAKIVVVTGGETDFNTLSDSGSMMIFDRRSIIQSYCLVCGHSTTFGQRFYFSFPTPDTLRLDYIRTAGGQSTGLHAVHLYR